ncbi:hypothetical protein GCM10022243_18110 [Saccharothrix violaceirubra]|uniref:Uncharacterized protein n=1 Tax=Saccharothrix violaceirubra TaxID=413306 RepID=A0A7W7WV05_9PSEU|nr:hypothetical protein [Saccharothrix violaceirubra]MBB4964397.1 hypothetical protein [Saccharothrix violaceirubra]
MSGTRLVGVLLLLAAAVTAALATFLPLFRYVQEFSPSNGIEFSSTSWEYEVRFKISADDAEGVDRSSDDQREPSPQFGVPVMFGVLVLFGAALLSFLPERQRLASRYAAVGASGVLIGGVGAAFAFAAKALTSGDPVRAQVQDGHYGAGLWLLLAATAAAVVGTVLLHTRRERAVEATVGVVYRVDEGDDDTPPFGIPVAVLPGDAVTGGPVRDTGPASGAGASTAAGVVGTESAGVGTVADGNPAGNADGKSEERTS